MIRRPLRIDLDGGERITGEAVVPAGAPPREAVVVVHGFKGFRRWGFFPFLVGRLAARGFAVVTFDFSRNGIGDDPERITRLDAFASNTFSREVEELTAVVDRVKASDLLPRTPDRIGLLGHSRGGSEAVLVAGGDRRIDALVTWSAVRTFDRWKTETREEWRRSGRQWVLEGRTGRQLPVDVTLLDDVVEQGESLDVEAAARKIDVPWLIVHGTGDDTVPVEEGRALARASKEARLMLIDGADHTYGTTHPFDGPSSWLEEATHVTLHHLEGSLKTREG